MSSEFSSLHQALVNHMHAPDGVSFVAREPVSTLGVRQGRFLQAVAETEPGGEASPLIATRREAIEALDQSLIALLAEQGHLSGVPRVKSKSVLRRSQARASASLRIASSISVSHDDTGRVRPLVPDDGAGEWVTRPSFDSWSHWGTLLHEASHCAFAKLERPFQTERLPAATVEDLNAYLLGPMASARGFFHRMLNESFADVYSSFLLHRLAPGDPGMRQEVDNLTWVRGQVRKTDFDPSLARGELVVSAPHQSDLALTLAWADPSKWEHLPAGDLMNAALGFASEGLLLLVTPGRPLTEEHALDHRMVAYLEREMGEFLSDGPLLSMAAHETATPARSRLTKWREAYPDHLGLTLVDQLLHKFNPEGKPLAELYPTLDSERRYEATLSWLERGMKNRGTEAKGQLKQRVHGMGEQLRAALKIEATADQATTPARRRVSP